MSVSKEIDLRFDVTKQLAQRIDALVQASGLKNRGELLTPVIEEFVKKEIHKSILLLRMCEINPQAAEAVGMVSD